MRPGGCSEAGCAKCAAGKGRRRAGSAIPALACAIWRGSTPSGEDLAYMLSRPADRWWWCGRVCVF